MFSKASSKAKSDVATTGIIATSTVASEAPRAAPRSTAPSIISGDLKIHGNLTSAGDLQIDGIVEGDIQSRSLTVGEGASVTGNIQADTVRVCGQVTGQIKAGTVNLERTAKVMGDIVHQILALEPGAFLEGHVRHSMPPAAAALSVPAQCRQARRRRAARPIEPLIFIRVRGRCRYAPGVTMVRSE